MMILGMEQTVSVEIMTVEKTKTVKEETEEQEGRVAWGLLTN
jgi:hypothetical protein